MPFLISMIITTLLQNSYLLIPESDTLLSTTVYMASSHLQTAVWVITLAVYLPYKLLIHKCSLMVYALYDINLAFEIMFLGNESLPIMSTLLAVFTFWLIFVFFRSYRKPNDQIDVNHIFYLKHRPDSLQDLVMALFCSPTGGNAIYMKGVVYHFHKGELKRTQYSQFTKAMRAKWQIVKGAPVDAKKLRRLEMIVGSKWTWYNNCLTMVYPIARWGHPLTATGVTMMAREFMKELK